MDKAFAEKQAAYEAYRRWYRECWELADAEDWCVRKGVQPGNYKPCVEG
jgi:hypothetical protein